MKTLNIIPIFFLLISCTENQSHHKEVSNTTISIPDTFQKTTTKVEDHIDFESKKYAEAIISGRVKPTDNDQTFAWLDSLHSENQNIRQYAFKVYKAMVTKSDGALSEAMCGYIKDYFISYPNEFLANYPTLTEEEKRQTIENIAFEFYASGTDYKQDFKEYFTSIESKCKDCTSKISASLKEIKEAIEKNVAHMVD